MYAYVRGYVLKAVDPVGLEDEKAPASNDLGSGASGTQAIDQAMQEMDRFEFELDPAEAYAAAERQNEQNKQEYAEAREAEAFEARVEAVRSGAAELTPESFGSPEVAEATRRVEEEASRAPIDGLLEKIEQDYGVDLKPLTEGLGLIAGFFGKGSPKVKAPGGGDRGTGSATHPKVPAAAESRAKSVESGIPESSLGPSGKPKIHVKEHATRKRAQEAALDRSSRSGTPEEHSNPTVGEPHFHPGGANDREHHAYPRKGHPRNERY